MPGNNLAGGSKKMTPEENEIGALLPGSKGTAPRIEEKLESQNTKITYLVRKINMLSKAQATGAGVNAVTQERLMQVAEKLRRLGVSVEYSDGLGYLKLKAYDQKGLDTIKKMNTIFPISLVESFLENQRSPAMPGR